MPWGRVLGAVTTFVVFGVVAWAMARSARHDWREGRASRDLLTRGSAVRQLIPAIAAAAVALVAPVVILTQERSTASDDRFTSQQVDDDEGSNFDVFDAIQVTVAGVGLAVVVVVAVGRSVERRRARRMSGPEEDHGSEP